MVSVNTIAFYLKKELPDKHWICLRDKSCGIIISNAKNY